MTFVAYETLSNNAVRIHEWNRPTADSDRVHTVRDDFEPYFLTSDIPVDNPLYKRIEDSEIISLIGNRKLRKVITRIPNDVSAVRDRTKDNYEDDVNFTSRYLIDTYLHKEFPSHFNTKLVFDIETNSKKALRQHYLGKAEVLSVGFINTKGKKWVYLLSPPNFHLKSKTYTMYSKILKENIDVIVFDTERDMLIAFWKIIEEEDPDIFGHWNGDNYDFPVLIARSIQLNVDYKIISPVRQVSIREKTDDRGMVTKQIRIGGRTSFDGLVAYRKMMIMKGQVRRYSLDDVSHDEDLKYKKLRKSAPVYDLWTGSTKNEIAELIAYNIQDVLATNEIMEKYKLVEHHEAMKRFTRSQFEDTFYNTLMIDNLLLHRARLEGYALPPRRSVAKQQKKGAVVLEPQIGKHEWVFGLDIEGMYPSNIMSLNLSPETYVHKDDLDPTRPHIKIYYPEKDDYLHFYIDKVGLLPKVLHGMFVIRKDVRDDMMEHDHGSHEHVALDLMQYAIKVVMNSVYGAMGFESFRLLSVPVAEATTLLGRIIIKWLEDKFIALLDHLVALGYLIALIIILYGDTDSVYLKLEGDFTPNDIEPIGYAMEKFLNATFDDMLKEYVILCADGVESPLDVDNELYKWYFSHVQKYEGQKHRITIAFESVFRRVVFMESKSKTGAKKKKGAKKRYYSLTVWTNKGGWLYKLPDGTPDTEKGKISIKGLERSDNSIYGTSLIEKVIFLILKEHVDTKEVYSFIEYARDEFLKQDEHDIAIYVPLNQPVSAYVNRPSKRGFVNMNKYLRKYPELGQRYPLWFISDTPTGIPPRKELCADRWEDVPQGWIIDMRFHWEKIMMILDPLLNPLGITHDFSLDLGLEDVI